MSETMPFAGLNARTGAEPPEWWVNSLDSKKMPYRTFSDVVRQLPGVTKKPVAYKDNDGNWVESERHVALTDPDRLCQMANTEDSDEKEKLAEKALYHVPTNNYSIIPYYEAFSPLEDLLMDEELGTNVFGEATIRRDGGEVMIDLLIDTIDIDDAEGRLAVGITTGQDFFGSRAFYAEGYARDGGCDNSIRRLTGKEVKTHYGAHNDFKEWWKDKVLSQALELRDPLREAIREAMDAHFDLDEMPFDLEEFYKLADFPEYLARKAADDARARTQSTEHATMWDLHSGATYALTHHFKGKPGSTTANRLTRSANDMMQNPSQTVTRIRRNFELKQLSDEGEDTRPGAIAEIEGVEETLEENLDQYNRRQEIIQSIMGGHDE